MWLAQRPELPVAATVIFYAARNGDFTRSHSRFLFHFAEDDDWVSAAGVKRIKKSLEAAGRDAVYHVYPRVIATNPKNGSAEVDPSLSRITVTFNKPMLDKSWSWSYEDKDSFPQTAGEPSYTENGTTCVLPVKLEPGKRYVIWINTARFKNFKDRNGNAVEPYRLVFTTRQK